MSYIWIYDASPTNMSYVNYTFNMDTYGNYLIKNKYHSFVEANEYLHSQIMDFISVFKDNRDPNTFNNIKTKSMVQRYQDIYNMQVILMAIMQQGLQRYYGTNYDSIRDILIDYSNYNETINNGLDEINNTPYSMNYSINTMLDSTIYSTVLYVILAICLVYYVFIKL
jgi:hypothetical protein